MDNAVLDDDYFTMKDEWQPPVQDSAGGGRIDHVHTGKVLAARENLEQNLRADSGASYAYRSRKKPGLFRRLFARLFRKQRRHGENHAHETSPGPLGVPPQGSA